MKIFVKNLMRKDIALDVEMSHTIAQVKEQIAAKVAIPPPLLQLYHRLPALSWSTTPLPSTRAITWRHMDRTGTVVSGSLSHTTHNATQRLTASTLVETLASTHPGIAENLVVRRYIPFDASRLRDTDDVDTITVAVATDPVTSKKVLLEPVPVVMPLLDIARHDNLLADAQGMDIGAQLPAGVLPLDSAPGGVEIQTPPRGPQSFCDDDATLADYDVRDKDSIYMLRLRGGISSGRHGLAGAGAGAGASEEAGTGAGAGKEADKEAGEEADKEAGKAGAKAVGTAAPRVTIRLVGVGDLTGTVYTCTRPRATLTLLEMMAGIL